MGLYMYVNQSFDDLYEKYEKKLYKTTHSKEWKSVFPKKVAAHVFLDKVYQELDPNSKKKLSHYFWGSPKVHGEVIKESIQTALTSEHLDEKTKEALRSLLLQYQEYFKIATIVDGMRLSPSYLKFILTGKGVPNKHTNILSEEFTALGAEVGNRIRDLKEGESMILPAGKFLHASIIYLQKDEIGLLKLSLIDQASDPTIRVFSCSSPQEVEELANGEKWSDFYRAVTGNNKDSEGLWLTDLLPHKTNLNAAFFKTRQKSDTCSLQSHEGLLRLAIVGAYPDDVEKGVFQYKIFKALMREKEFNRLDKKNKDLLTNLSELKTRSSQRYIEWEKEGSSFIEAEEMFHKVVEAFSSANEQELSHLPDYVQAKIQEEKLTNELAESWLEGEMATNQSYLGNLRKVVSNYLNSATNDHTNFILKKIIPSFLKTHTPEEYFKFIKTLHDFKLFNPRAEDLIELNYQFVRKIEYIDNEKQRIDFIETHLQVLEKISDEKISFRAVKKILKQDDVEQLKKCLSHPASKKIINMWVEEENEQNLIEYLSNKQNYNMLLFLINNYFTEEDLNAKGGEGASVLYRVLYNISRFSPANVNKANKILKTLIEKDCVINANIDGNLQKTLRLLFRDPSGNPGVLYRSEYPEELRTVFEAKFKEFLSSHPSDMSEMFYEETF